MSFSDSFAWGAATASYQIEGGHNQDGRKPSVWDMLCRKPGAVYEGHTGDTACDHYNRSSEDVALMQALGLNAYRFSVAWPRVMPDGTGSVNEKGLAFYDKLVDDLLAAGIAPWATLYHWDLPIDLYHRGGWMNPDMPKYFADYAAVVVDRLSDRVQNWMTLNEANVFIGLGLWQGIHAPGDKLRWDEVLLATHHTHIAHGLAVQVIRARGKKRAKIGAAPACHIAIPHTNDPRDVEAARKATFSVKEQNTWQPAWWLDPLFFGHYPEDGLMAYGERVPQFKDSDFDTIKQPLDFFGMNVYHGRPVKANEEGEPEYLKPGVGEPQTAFRWPVTPQCLYWAPKFYYERYGKPIFVTENGLSNQDWVQLDGKVHDSTRIDFLHRHLIQLRRAAADGVDVGGYFQWSLLDNFEWAEGYKERFGLIHVDFETLVRTPKDSYHWYRDVIATNGENLQGQEVKI